MSAPRRTGTGSHTSPPTGPATHDPNTSPASADPMSTRTLDPFTSTSDLGADASESRAHSALAQRLGLADTISVGFAFAVLLYVGPLWMLGHPASAMAMCMFAVLFAASTLLQRRGFDTAARVAPTLLSTVLLTAMTARHGVGSQIQLGLFCLIPVPLLLFDAKESRAIILQELAIGLGLTAAWALGQVVPPTDDLARLWPAYPNLLWPLCFAITLGLTLKLHKTASDHATALQHELEERRAAEHRARQSRAIAELAARSRTEYAANVSHEIRTPLNGVLGLTELLSATVLTPRQREMVSLLHASGDFLRLIVDDILDFSSIDSEQLLLTDEPFFLVQALEDCLPPFAQLGAKKQLAVCSDVSVSGDVEVRGDAQRLRQIVSNLLSNAIKFTPQGVVTMRLSARRQGEAVALTVEVEDTGTGIAEGDLERIFEPFAHTRTDRAHISNGTGLGLAICERLTRMMGGTLTVRSQVDVGSTFTLRVTLPATGNVVDAALLDGPRVGVISPFQRQVDALVATLQRMGALATGASRLTALPEDVDVVLVDHGAGLEAPTRAAVAGHLGLPERRVLELRSELGDDQTVVWPGRRAVLRDAIQRRLTAVPDRAGPVADLAPGGPVFLGLHALVAEDSPVNQLVLRGYLAELGITCDVVTDGRAACEAFDARRHHLLLMDVQMPDVDGASATTWIRTHAEGGGTIPIIAITADSSPAARAAAASAGFDAYLTKPIRAGGIRDAIARFFPAAGAG